MLDTDNARRVLSLLDLTSLNEHDDEAAIAKLCARAVSEHGPVAAVCVWPRFVPLCRKWLWDTGVRLATVANFPAGRDDIEIAVAETAAAIAYGADEVDLVFPYRLWLAGEQRQAHELVAACKQVCGGRVRLKVILETGCLESAQNIKHAALEAIAAGADFIKTSTGKTPVSATLEAAQAMLEAIRQSNAPVGFKASGGIRSLAQASAYLELADTMMGDHWAGIDTFRFGASSLLDDLLATLSGQAPPAKPQGY
jgi:deoxyribose-phosphate aldolase